MALCMQHIVELYHVGLLKRTIFDIQEEYEVVNKYFNGSVHIMHNETSRHVYLCNPVIIGGYNDSVINQVRKIVDTINPDLDQWSLVIPLGDSNYSFFRELGRQITRSEIKGHAMLMIIEKNYHIYKSYVINPGFFTWFQSEELYNVLRGFFEDITFNEYSAGIQNIFENKLCVYYVFKIIYFYLMDGADLNSYNLLNRLCPYQYGGGIVMSLAEIIFEVTKFYIDMYGDSHVYLSDYEVKEIESLCYPDEF